MTVCRRDSSTENFQPSTNSSKDLKADLNGPLLRLVEMSVALAFRQIVRKLKNLDFKVLGFNGFATFSFFPLSCHTIVR